MRKLVLTILLFINSFSSIFAQVPDWIWARSGGGSANEAAYSVTTDILGNVYIAGTFSSNTIAFGSFTLSTTFSLKPALFFVKYDSNGNVIWAKTAVGRVSTYGMGLATDPAGNIYVTGGFESSSIIFDSITLNQDSVGADIFIAKYDNSGNVVWAKRAGGSTFDNAYSIDSDAYGNLYVGGTFSGTCVFGSDTLISNSNYSDLLLLKFDNNGNEIWARRAGGIYGDEIKSVVIDTFGNIFIAGSFQSSTLLFGNDTLLNSGQWDPFIAKYDNFGNELWAKSSGSTIDDKGTSLTSDASGNVYMSGWFKGSSITFGTTTLNNSSFVYDDIFIVKYDGNGNVIWANGAGGNRHDQSLGICTDGIGNVYISGLFESPTAIFGTVTLTKPGLYDAEVFLANYDLNGNIIWAKKGSGAGYDWSQSVTIDNSGNVYIAGYYGGFSILFGAQYINSSANGNHTEVFISKLGLTVGLNEVNNSNLIFIYTNPVQEHCIIYANPSVKSIQIINSLGQEIWKLMVDGEGEFSFTFNRSGLFYIRITTLDEIITQRIAVCR